MSATTRQNELILNQDWTRIYQTFKNADFKSYDFENLRRVMIAYLREQYPEDFNDYIESSEYMALIDAIAFLGQSLAFRIDLTSRENFIELAERRDSVLRLARMLSYNAKRNVAASGLLKFTSISTTQDVFDSNGRNIGRRTIQWNDPANPDWFEHFVLILNEAMPENTEFGRDQRPSVIQGISTEQYRINSVNNGVPLFSFTKSVANQRMSFEIVSTGFQNREEIYEEDPVAGRQFGFVYRNDGRGVASANTGFFAMFKQGSLEQIDFNISNPVPNERVYVNTPNINNDDVWLYSASVNGLQSKKWEQVPSLTGNNVAYNSVFEGIRDVFFVETRANDTVELVFSDGVFGDLPSGDFRLFVRVSNGLEYTIRPSEMQNINIPVEYVDASGNRQTVRIGLSLQNTVANAAAAETTDEVRTRAPAQYYTQDRMISGEDYNLAPLTSSQNLIKVKAVNRVSSGVSRNFDLIDASGKYSDITVFADDGYIYKQDAEKFLNLRFTNNVDVLNFIRESINPVFDSLSVYNFYLDKFPRQTSFNSIVTWQNVSQNDTNLSTGFLVDNLTPVAVGSAASDDLKFVETGAMIKFGPPIGQTFSPAESSAPDRLWAKVVNVLGDGTISQDGFGGIFVNEEIPEGAILEAIIPKFVNVIPSGLEQTIAQKIMLNETFALRYNQSLRLWRIIPEEFIDTDSEFSLANAGSQSTSLLDASWLMLFTNINEREYSVRVRTLEYAFGSFQQNRFYFDPSALQYNRITNSVAYDRINILPVNLCVLNEPLADNVTFSIVDTVKYNDGYESTSEVLLNFNDRDRDGIIDNPDSFALFVEESDKIVLRRTVDRNGNVVYVLDQTVAVEVAESTPGELYKVVNGRANLKFQYIHNADSNRRIDPSASNIIDLYLMTRSYDRQFREFLAGVAERPEPPTTESLRITFGSKLSAVKSISDEIIYHPVKYRVLFGSTAEPKLRAVFKVVKNPSRVINDGDLKVRIVSAFEEFFDLNNWDFGDRFYVTELVAYVLNTVSPDVANMVIVPRDPNQTFGSLFEIQSRPDEIFINGATVDDIQIVSSISATEVNAPLNRIISAT